MNLNRCINCGSRVFDDGFCGEINCNSYYSQCDKTCAPAPKEKEMKFECRCKKCDAGFMSNRNSSKLCGTCAADATTQLRAVWEKAYFAALESCACSCAPDHAVMHSHKAALETVRQWPAMTAERDAIIAKAVQG